MLTRVDISNYRGFKSYHMQGLAHVNLLVGKNNSGKTSLLEGLQFLTSGGDPAVLADVAARRGEIILARPDPSPMTEIGHFFYGHGLLPESSFTIAGDNGYPPVTVRVVPMRNKSDASAETGVARTRHALFALKIDGGRQREREERVFPIAREGAVDFEISPRMRRMALSRKPEGPPVRFISTESLDTAVLASMWDEVTLGGLEEEVRDALRVLDRQVQTVHMLTGMFAFGYVGSRAGIVLGLDGQKARVPLGSMGDGMRRLLALAIAMACSKDGAIFVDEIDTGLHYSVMADMWRLVVKRAIAANVQVFATTHSWDCIEGLAMLCQQDQDARSGVAVHKIDRVLQNSVAFTGDAIVRMVKSDIDPR